MKILYIITQADAGGAQKYVLELAQAFGGEIACGTGQAWLADEAKKLGVPIHGLPHLKRSISPWNDFLALSDLVKLVKETRPDIVHLNSSKAGVLGSFIKLFVDVKIVYTAHGFVFNEPSSQTVKTFYIWAERLASKFRDYIIAVSEADRQSALVHSIISANKISVVHNGLEPISFLDKTEAIKKLNLPPNKTIVGTIANFYKTKGLDVLIEAVAQMDRKILDNFCFPIIGDGGERKTYEELIIKYDLKKTFILLGQLPNASQYLKAFDIFVFPSRKEGFSFILLEAMQAGLPIIATDVGGNKEALGEGGVLIPSERPDILAKAILDLIVDVKKQGAMSKSSLERSKEFSLKKMLTETREVYESILKNL